VHNVGTLKNEGGGSINNYGSFYFNLPANLQSDFYILWNNYGYAEINSGYMYLRGGGVSTGAFTINSPAVLRPISNAYQLQTPVTFNGTGTFYLAEGSYLYIGANQSASFYGSNAVLQHYSGTIYGSGSLEIYGNYEFPYNGYPDNDDSNKPTLDNITLNLRGIADRYQYVTNYILMC
jgi:hypothetical protein